MCVPMCSYVLVIMVEKTSSQLGLQHGDPEPTVEEALVKSPFFELLDFPKQARSSPVPLFIALPLPGTSDFHLPL